MGCEPGLPSSEIASEKHVKARRPLASAPRRGKRIAIARAEEKRGGVFEFKALSFPSLIFLSNSLTTEGEGATAGGPLALIPWRRGFERSIVAFG